MVLLEMKQLNSSDFFYNNWVAGEKVSNLVLCFISQFSSIDFNQHLLDHTDKQNAPLTSMSI